MASIVTTVLGPVPPGALGVTDAHNHLYIGRVPGAPPDAPVLSEREGQPRDGIRRELAAFRALGGGAIVDCQPGGCGRDGRVLRQLSRATGVHVVAATGFHRRRYYPPGAPLFALSAERAAAVFQDEIARGLEETRGDGDAVYPGVIKIAAEAALEATPPALLAAAAEVCRATGYAMEVHTERGAAVEALLDYFSARGVAPQRLVFCHVDKRPDFGLHRALAGAGVLLEYDTFYRPQYDPERGVWPLLARMIDAGLSGSVALATDMADPALWAELGGGPGLPGIFSHIAARLPGLGADATASAALLGGNIAARLATGNAHD